MQPVANPGDVVTGEYLGVPFIGRVHSCQMWRSRWGNGRRCHYVVHLDGVHPHSYELDGRHVLQCSDAVAPTLVVIQHAALAVANHGGTLVLAEAA
jgi:hypothetical protein